MVSELRPEGELPTADPAVRRQLAELFGERLFGPWPELDAHVVAPRRRRRFGPWLWKLTIVAGLVGLVWGGARLLQPGLERQVDHRRGSYAGELQSFLGDGDLERAAQFVVLVRERAAAKGSEAEAAATDTLDARDPHLELLLTAEAKLYRHWDADPARLRRIEPHLGGAGLDQPQRLVASLTLLSRAERAARLPEIERLHNELPNRNDVEYLLATALSQRGDEKAAREAWSSSERLGPAWLGHRYEQAWFELQHGKKDAARKVASQIRRVDPDSPWSRLAVVTFALPEDHAVQSIRAEAAAPMVGPVQTYFEQLQRSIAAGHRQDWGEAKQVLDAAMTAVHGQAPFVLDAFDWMLREQLPMLARHLTQLPSWPGSNPTALAELGRLDAATPVSPAPHANPGDVGAPSAPKSKPPSPRAAGKRKAVRRAAK